MMLTRKQTGGDERYYCANCKGMVLSDVDKNGRRGCYCCGAIVPMSIEQSGNYCRGRDWIEYGRRDDVVSWQCRYCNEEYSKFPDLIECLNKHSRVVIDNIGVVAANTAVRPSYYKGRDVMDIANRYELTKCEFQVLKYLLRAKKKNGVEDLKKAKWYLEEEIRLLETPKIE